MCLIYYARNSLTFKIFVLFLYHCGEKSILYPLIQISCDSALCWRYHDVVILIKKAPFDALKICMKIRFQCLLCMFSTSQLSEWYHSTQNLTPRLVIFNFSKNLETFNFKPQTSPSDINAKIRKFMIFSAKTHDPLFGK